MFVLFKPFAWAAKKLASLFTKAMSEAEKFAPTAVRVTALLKNIVESPITGTVVSITPTHTDDVALAVLKKLIPKVAEKVAVTANILQSTDNNTDAVAALAEYLKTLVPDGRAKFYVEFAAQLNVALANGKIDFNEAVILTQIAFKAIFKQQASL